MNRPGTLTDPGWQTRAISLRSRSTIIRFSARFFGSVARKPRWARSFGRIAVPRLGAFHRTGLYVALRVGTKKITRVRVTDYRAARLAKLTHHIARVAPRPGPRTGTVSSCRLLPQRKGEVCLIDTTCRDEIMHNCNSGLICCAVPKGRKLDQLCGAGCEGSLTEWTVDPKSEQWQAALCGQAH